MNSGSYEHHPVRWKRRTINPALLAVAVLLCVASGIGLGYLIADSRHGEETSVDGPAPDDDGREPPSRAESMVVQRLGAVAVEEASDAVQLGLDDARRVQSAASEVTAPGADPQGPIPMRVRSNHDEIEVRSGGERAERLSRDVYRVDRRAPVEVQFDPFASSRTGEGLEISVTPLLETEITDPWEPDE